MTEINLPTSELEAELLIHRGTIEAYKGNLDRSAEFWKAVEMKNKIEAELKRR